MMPPVLSLTFVSSVPGSEVFIAVFIASWGHFKLGLLELARVTVAAGMDAWPAVAAVDRADATF